MMSMSRRRTMLERNARCRCKSAYNLRIAGDPALGPFDDVAYEASRRMVGISQPLGERLRCIAEGVDLDAEEQGDLREMREERLPIDVRCFEHDQVDVAVFAPHLRGGGTEHEGSVDAVHVPERVAYERTRISDSR